MATQPITIHLSEKEHEFYLKSAQACNCTVEEAILEILYASQDLQFDLLETDKLWEFVNQAQFASRKSRLNELMKKKQSVQLTEIESDEVEFLSFVVHRYTWIYSQSLAELQKREQDVSRFFTKTSE